MLVISWPDTPTVEDLVIRGMEALESGILDGNIISPPCQGGIEGGVITRDER